MVSLVTTISSPTSLAGTQPQSPMPWIAMAAEIQPSQATPTFPSKRKSKTPNSNKPYKKLKPTTKKSQKLNHKMQKLYCKRAKDYHSSDEEVPEEAHTESATAGGPEDRAASSDSEGEASVDELGEDGPHQGITKLAEGSRAFKLTFLKIMKKKLPNEPLGPVLSAHKSLAAEKLAEEATEHKAKAETKRLK